MQDALDESFVRFVDAGGIRTRVYESGDGEPIVLIHGGGFGSLYSLDSWSLVLPRLCEHFRVLAFDKLGQGHTEEPADGDYTFDAVFRHTLAVLAALDSGPAHLAGHSMGAFLATRIALERPELVRTLMIVDSNTTAPDDPRYPWTAFYDDLDARLPADHPTPESVRIEPTEQSFASEHVTEDFVERMYAIALLRSEEEPACRAAPAAFWTDSIVKARRENLQDLGERGLSVPTLVVWGAEDPSAPLPLALSLFELIAGRTEEAELHVLARAGHYPFREQPEAFARLLISFCLGR